MVIRSRVDRAERWVLTSILALALSAIPVMTDSADFVLFFGGDLLLGVVLGFLSTVLLRSSKPDRFCCGITTLAADPRDWRFFEGFGESAGCWLTLAGG